MSEPSQPASGKPSGVFTVICNELSDVRITSAGPWKDTKVKTHIKVGDLIHKGQSYTVSVEEGVIKSVAGPQENKVKQRKDEQAAACQAALAELQSGEVEFEAGDAAQRHVTGTRGQIASEVEGFCQTITLDDIRGVSEDGIDITCGMPDRRNPGETVGKGWNIVIKIKDASGGRRIAGIYHYGPRA